MTEGAVPSFKAVLSIKECVFCEGTHPTEHVSSALQNLFKPSTWLFQTDKARDMMAHAGWMIFGRKVHLFASGHSSSYIKENIFRLFAFRKFWW